jgi:ATP-dependent DNA helicase RecG
VFAQLDAAYSYLSLCNKTAATFRGLERIESKDYPDAALREALLNALVHRDYSFSGSVIINVNDSEMEFISIGGLLPGLSPEDIRSGISQPRNQHLADIFHRLRLIESYGTGIRRIYSLYAKCAAQPRIEVTANTFKIILPNMNRVSAAEGCAPSDQKQKILSFMEKNGGMTEGELMDLLRVKKTRAYNVAREMCAAGLIKPLGRGSAKKYVKA